MAREDQRASSGRSAPYRHDIWTIYARSGSPVFWMLEQPWNTRDVIYVNLATQFLEHGSKNQLGRFFVAVRSQVFGVDTELILDETYFVAEVDENIVGCGGWSWRATLFGGDDSIVAREPEPLNPATDAAKIRAMYVLPKYARRGIGTMIMLLCESAAREAGFARTEMMATLAGVPLYRASGYLELEPVEATTREGIVVPLVRMGKTLI